MGFSTVSMDAGGWYHLSQCPQAKAYCRAGSRNCILEFQSSSTSLTTLSLQYQCWGWPALHLKVLQRTWNVTSIVNLTVEPISLLSVTVFELPVLPVLPLVIGRYTVQTSWPPTPRYCIFSRPAPQKPRSLCQRPRKEKGCHYCLYESISKYSWPTSNDDLPAALLSRENGFRSDRWGPADWQDQLFHGDHEHLVVLIDCCSFQSAKVAYTKLAMVIDYRQEEGSVDFQLQGEWTAVCTAGCRTPSPNFLYAREGR